MGKYDFKKPFKVSIYEENDCERCEDNLSFNTSDVCSQNRNEARTLNRSTNQLQTDEINQITSIYFQEGTQKINETYEYAHDMDGNVSTQSNKHVLFNDAQHENTWISELLFSSQHVSNSQSSPAVNNVLSSGSYSNLNYNELKTLSSNIIHILKAYRYYVNIGSNVTNELRLKEKERYFQTKEYYFRSSRKILQRLHSNDFDLTDFINKTSNIAIYQYKLLCSHNDITSIVHELVMSTRFNRNVYQPKSLPTYEQAIKHLNNGYNTVSQTEKQYLNNLNKNNLQQQRKQIQQKSVNDPKTHVFKYGSPDYEIRLEVNTETLNTQSNIYQNMHNIAVRNKSSSSYEHVRIPNQTIDASNTTAILASQVPNQDEPQIQQELIRSISRDSGFNSPCIDQLGSEERCTQDSPYITHVTSLNPQAMHIPLGNCQVCGVPTSHKCLGCYKSYYCTTQCQAKEWHKHKFDCRNRNR